MEIMKQFITKKDGLMKNENGLEQRLIVSYSPKYAEYQRSVRNRQIERAQKFNK